MIKFRGCPKCRGDLYLTGDHYGRYLNCLQCGFVKDLPQPTGKPAPVKPLEPALAARERKAA